MGMTPIGRPSRRSAEWNPRPVSTVSSSHSDASGSSVAIFASGLTISISLVVMMSAAVSSPGPVFSRVSVTGSLANERRRICFRLRTSWTTSSWRRGMVGSSGARRRTRAAVIAAPGSELRSTRRSEFPRVVPYPGGSGSHANFAYRSSPSMRSILGYSSSTRVMASVPSCGASALVSALRLRQRSSRLGLASSRVMLDDELGVDLCFDLITTRRREDFRGVRVGIDLEPARTRLRLRPGGHLLEVVGGAALLGDGDGIAGLHRVARRLGLAAVHGDVAVSHELPRLRARLREPGAVHRVVEAPFEVDEKRLAGRAGDFGGPVERVLHLALEHAVHATRLLLLAKLEREVAHLPPALLVHAGRRRALLERALGEALLALEEELHALAAADPAD